VLLVVVLPTSERVTEAPLMGCWLPWSENVTIECGLTCGGFLDGWIIRVHPENEG